jgi:hypothetical protein
MRNTLFIHVTEYTTLGVKENEMPIFTAPSRYGKEASEKYVTQEREKFLGNLDQYAERVGVTRVEWAINGGAPVDGNPDEFFSAICAFCEVNATQRRLWDAIVGWGLRSRTLPRLFHTVLRRVDSAEHLQLCPWLIPDGTGSHPELCHDLERIYTRHMYGTPTLEEGAGRFVELGGRPVTEIAQELWGRLGRV